jgi:hypothetical protein
MVQDITAKMNQRGGASSQFGSPGLLGTRQGPGPVIQDPGPPGQSSTETGLRDR